MRRALVLQNNCAMWHHVSTAPFDRDLELAVIDDGGGVHALVFPCRRISNGWMKAGTKERLDVRPTHWREWQSAPGEPDGHQAPA